MPRFTHISKHAVCASACLATNIIFTSIGHSDELIVEASVSPSISVRSYASRVNIGSISTGDFSGTFTFAIEANTGNISIQVEATDLYKNTNPSSSSIKPIPLNRAAGVDILAPSATITDGSGWNAPFYNNAQLNKPEGIFNCYRTEEIKLMSKQDGIFNQDIDLRVTWTQTEPVKPAGSYGGYIIVHAALIE